MGHLIQFSRPALYSHVECKSCHVWSDSWDKLSSVQSFRDALGLGGPRRSTGFRPLKTLIWSSNSLEAQEAGR